MGYMMDTTLKVSFKEYNNFEKFIKEYVINNNNGYVPQEIIDDGDIIDYLYDYKYMDTNCMAICGMYKYGSLAYDALNAYTVMVSHDDDKEDEYAYLEYGEDLFDACEWSGNIDAFDGPQLDCFINANLSDDVLDVEGKYKIIIE